MTLRSFSDIFLELTMFHEDRLGVWDKHTLTPSLGQNNAAVLYLKKTFYHYSGYYPYLP